MGTVPRQGYFLGKIAKAITGGAKKIFKSPIGKAAVLGGLGYLTGGGGMPKFLGGSGLGGFEMGKILPNLLYKDPSKAFSLANLSPLKIGGAMTAAPFAMAATGNWAPDEQFDELKLKSQEFGFDYSQMIRDIQNAENEEDYLAVLANII